MDLYWTHVFLLLFSHSHSPLVFINQTFVCLIPWLLFLCPLVLSIKCFQWKLEALQKSFIPHPFLILADPRSIPGTLSPETRIHPGWDASLLQGTTHTPWGNFRIDKHPHQHTVEGKPHRHGDNKWNSLIKHQTPNPRTVNTSPRIICNKNKRCSPCGPLSVLGPLELS